jgi:hypothetical protein
MKFECPVCGIVGILQQRGNSNRVQHYQGFENGKRIYLYHKVECMEVNGSNGSKLLEVKKGSNDVILGKEAPPKGCATYNGRKLLVLFLNLFVFHSINP